jgi:hypothetical protein
MRARAGDLCAKVSHRHIHKLRIFGITLPKNRSVKFCLIGRLRLRGTALGF